MAEKFTLDWERSRINIDATMREALQAINACGAMMACVVDSAGGLLGIITDSDIRRALLKGIELDTKMNAWMNSNPVVCNNTHSIDEIKRIAHEFNIREIPIVDGSSRLVDIFALGTHETKRKTSEQVISNQPPIEQISTDCSMMILAGGLGSRLRSVVSDRPKSLAVVGEKPILETVILQAAEQGIRKFYVSVNYLAEQIEQHLEQACYKDLQITVIREPKRMGTAGSLSLIPDKVTTPLIVANSDILTKAPLPRMLRQHVSRNAFITCAVRPYNYRVPFGVCHVQDLRIQKIEEKPEVTALVNAGVYILSPEAVSQVPKNQFFDMPDLLNIGIQSKQLVSPFYLHEYWIDIGKPEDFAKANDEFHLHFGG